MRDLGRLLARVNVATGPDSELDQDIAMQVVGMKPTIRIGHEILGNEREVPGHVPRYTASLDAALALVNRVLPRWQIALAGPWFYAPHTATPGRPIWCAEIARDTEDDGLGYKEVNDLPWSAATPALALVAALLHALIDAPAQTAVGSAYPNHED